MILYELCGILGGIEADGRIYIPIVGEPSQKDWYNRRTGRLYISHFKTQESAARKPCDFNPLHPSLIAAIDVTLAPGAHKANREYLVNTIIGTKGEKKGIILPVLTKIKEAFRVVR